MNSESTSLINVCIAGATGWAGRALVDGALEADGLVLRVRVGGGKGD